MNEIQKKILKKMFWKNKEFQPRLTPEQYAVYVKHLKEAIKDAEVNNGKKKK